MQGGIITGGGVSKMVAELNGSEAIDAINLIAARAGVSWPGGTFDA